MYNTFFVLHVFEQLLFVVQIFFRQPRILIVLGVQIHAAIVVN